MKYLLFYLFFNIILISCITNTNDKKQCYYNSFSKKHIANTKKIKIPIDSTIDYKSHLVFVDNQKLFRANNANNSIDVFDLTNKIKTNTIKYDREGKNKINRFGGASIIKLESDNHFLIGNLLGEIYITKQNTVIKKINLSDSDLFSSKEYRLYGINDTKAIKIGNEIFFYKVSQYLQTNEQFYKEKLLISYNMQTNKVKELNVLYPKSYHQKSWSFAHIYPSMTLNNNNEIIFSFPITSSLYTYNNKTNTMKKVDKCLRSKFDKFEVKSIKSNLKNFQEKNKFIKTQIRYRSIIFDKYRNLYYRLIALPIDTNINPNNRDKFWDISPLVLMVLDENFNVIAETKLPPMIYNYREYFVDKEGLWISENNPNNEDFNENILSYSLFKVI